MLDRDVAAASPTSVYRVLKAAGRIGRFAGKPSQKGQGFHQPTRPHQHWHIDISYLNILGTFYSLCSLIDGYSRYIVHWEIRETMKERETEVIVQRGREKFPGENPRIISDNGPQFVAKDFKEFIRICGMTHVRTSPYFCTDTSAEVRDVLEAVAARWAIEEHFHDVKEVRGAGQQQVRNVWSNIGCWHLNQWLYTLVELCCWDVSKPELTDRQARSWDNPDRRPSHADRRRWISRTMLQKQFLAVLPDTPDRHKFRNLIDSLLSLCV